MHRISSAREPCPIVCTVRIGDWTAFQSPRSGWWSTQSSGYGLSTATNMGAVSGRSRPSRVDSARRRRSDDPAAQDRRCGSWRGNSVQQVTRAGMGPSGDDAAEVDARRGDADRPAQRLRRRGGPRRPGEAVRVGGQVPPPLGGAHRGARAGRRRRRHRPRLLPGQGVPRRRPGHRSGAAAPGGHGHLRDRPHLAGHLRHLRAVRPAPAHAHHRRAAAPLPGGGHQRPGGGT